MERITITIPDWTPTLALSPNRQTHWRTKKRHRDDARNLALGIIRGWRNDHGHYGDAPLIPGKATIAVVVRWEKGRKQMDGDNIVGCLKSTVDALEQGGIIGNDRDLTWLPVIQERGEDGKGAVVLTIESLAAGRSAGEGTSDEPTKHH